VTDKVKSMSLFGGFLTIFTGVYLLNFNGSHLDVPESPSEYELSDVVGSSRAVMSLVGSPRSSRDTLPAVETRRSHSHDTGSAGSVLE